MASAIRIISEEASFCDQEFEAMLEAAMYRRMIDSLANTVVAGNITYGCSTVSMDEIQTGRPPREHRFDVLRAEGKKLGEINAILEAEGYSEVFGEGVMPCPTKSHEIVRENKGAREMVETMGGY